MGDLECMAISDGTWTYGPPTFPPPAEFLFTNAPRELLGRALSEHGIRSEQWTAYVSPFTCVMVNTGRHRVLVDTGADGLDPNSTGRLPRNLQAVGVETGDIDTVILTHGHGDHIGGNTDAEGKPAFPKARYVMRKEEWTFWTSEAGKIYEEVEFAFERKNLLAIQHQVDLLDDEAEIVPGIRAVAAPGHTPGHMAVAISSHGEQLLCVSDAFLHPIHVEHPDWHGAIDMAPEQVTKTKHLLLDKAVTEKALMLGFHFPFPGLGHVIKKGTGWQWQPVRRLDQA